MSTVIQHTRLTGHGSRFVKINNTDELCCARAIVTSRAHADHKGDMENNALRRRYQYLRDGDRGKRAAQKVGVHYMA